MLMVPYLIAKSNCHHSDKHAKERLQFTQPILVQKKESESISHSDQDASPQWDPVNKNEKHLYLKSDTETH